MRTRAVGMLDLWAGALTSIGAIAWGLYGLLGFRRFQRRIVVSDRVEKLLYTAFGIAGMWIGIKVWTPLILDALGIKAMRSVLKRPFQTLQGRMLPTIGGITLNGREVLIPSGTLGRVTFLVLGFSYDQLTEAERWIRAIGDRFSRDENVDYYLIAMVPGVYGPLSPLVDIGLKRVFPSDLRDHILVVHGSVGSFRRVLAAPHFSNVWLYLLNSDGSVAFQYGGSYDENVFRQMATEAENALRRIEVVPIGRIAEIPRAA